VGFHQAKKEIDISAGRAIWLGHRNGRLKFLFIILTAQLQIAQKEIQKGEAKIELLRQEKLFLAQEKAHFKGALKQLQKKYGNPNPLLKDCYRRIFCALNGVR